MSALRDAARARTRQGAFIIPFWWTDEGGTCACPKGAACPSPGKHPLTKRGLDDASTDLAQIDRWWRRWPKANLGETTDEVGRIDIDLVDGQRRSRTM